MFVQGAFAGFFGGVIFDASREVSSRKDIHRSIRGLLLSEEIDLV